jgi:hypothetical protein
MHQDATLLPRRDETRSCRDALSEHAQTMLLFETIAFFGFCPSSAVTKPSTIPGYNPDPAAKR